MAFLAKKLAVTQNSFPNGTSTVPASNLAKTTYTKQVSGLNSSAGSNQFSRISTGFYNGTVTAEKGISTMGQTPPAGGTLPGSK